LGRDARCRGTDRDLGDGRSKVQSLEVEELGEHHGVLVGRALGDRGRAPVVRESALASGAGEAHRVGGVGSHGAKETDQRLGVTDVHC
jgi:hypothetical protein